MSWVGIVACGRARLASGLRSARDGFYFRFSGRHPPSVSHAGLFFSAGPDITKWKRKALYKKMEIDVVWVVLGGGDVTSQKLVRNHN